MVGLPLLLAVPVAGCTTSAQAPAAKVTVQPQMSVADQSVQIRVTRLAAGQQATVHIRSTDAAGALGQSSAVYRADAAGAIDQRSARGLSGQCRAVPRT